MIGFYFLGLMFGLGAVLLTTAFSYFFIFKLGKKLKKILPVIVALFYWTSAIGFVYASNYIFDKFGLSFKRDNPAFYFILLWLFPFIGATLFWALKYREKINRFSDAHGN